MIGSAVLFGYGQFSGLLTARHVWEAAEGKRLMLRTPNQKEGVARFTNLPAAVQPWSVNLSLFQNEDVVVIPLPRELASELEQDGTFIEPPDIGSPDDSAPGERDLFLIAGFPRSKNKGGTTDPKTSRAFQAWRNQALVILANRRLGEEYLSGKSSRTHFALEAFKVMDPIYGNGGSIGTPSLRGMSGGGVWKLSRAPEHPSIVQVSLVGILIERRDLQGRIAVVFVRVDWAKDYHNWADQRMMKIWQGGT